MLRLRILKNRKARVAFVLFAALLLFLLVPYGFSRVMNSTRALSIETVEVEADAMPNTPPGASLRVACYNIETGQN